MATLKSLRRLKILLALNILASIGHYVDNVLFFDTYPEPDWLNWQMVDLFWFFMTPFALLGYRFYKNGKGGWAMTSLIAYSCMSLLVLQHYKFAPFAEIEFRIHFFIWLEAVFAIALILYVLFNHREFASASK